MSNNGSFQPNWASAPGDTISDVLKERGLTLSEFMRRVGATSQEIDDLLQGRISITIALARRLETVLGGSVEFWMARDFQYRELAARRDSMEREWVSQLPVSDMVKFGWLAPPPRPVDEVAACLRFFGVVNVPTWRHRYETLSSVAFRTSPTLDSRPGSVAAWLRQGEIEATNMSCKPWDAQGFRESLAEIRGLTRQKDPSRFIPSLQQRCAEHGVAVVIVRAPAGCRASGATMFLSHTKALLLLSFRHLTDDHVWFSFFHEAGHLLLHGRTTLFLEGLEPDSSTEEREANDFAGEALVPAEFQSAMRRLPQNASDVIRFARRAGVSPGIIVGQLQHVGHFKINQLNSLKRRFRWDGTRLLSHETA